MQLKCSASTVEVYSFLCCYFIDPLWFLPKVWIPAGFAVRVPVVMVLAPKIPTDYLVFDLLCIDG